jgi:hypothetical protein
MIKPTWGLVPTETARFAWGARAIHKGVETVWDRQGIDGEATTEEKKALIIWLEKKALPLLRSMDLPYPEEDREVQVSGDGFTLRANPRASHGYLYLSAAPDASATMPTPAPIVRPVNDSKTQCKHCKAYPESRHLAECPSAARVAARQAKSGVESEKRYW